MKQLVLASTVVASLFVGLAMADDARPKAPPARPADPKPAPKPVTVKLTDARGASIGSAKLSADPRGVKLTLALKGLSPGVHAIHVHETAKCEAPDFKSAGGHFNPEHKQHGLDNPRGPHAGDMPNFTVDARGTANATLLAPGVTLEDGPHSVFAGGGTALVIHDKPDDMKSDPAGNAGDRIACGLIKK